MTYTRRDLAKLALASFPAASQLAKPNSTFAGVWIGVIISPVNFHDIPLAADEILNNVAELGISGIELQDVRVESYAGAPVTAPRGSTPRLSGAGQTPSAAARRQAQSKAAEEIKAWRLAASMDKYKALRKMYADAGVKIYAYRLARVTKDTTGDEFDYFFNTAQALGANQITLELPTDPALTQRLGDYAASRKMMIGYHNHTQVNFNSWDNALEQSKHNGVNFDVGHYTAAVNDSPIPFIEKHHDRITCLHLKDRKFGSRGGQNVPWGQGDTPLKAVLSLMKREKYRFPAGIELEYRIPEGSTTMTELTKCLDFCRDALQ